MINFPINPTLNQEYTFAGKTWVFNGTGWVVKGGETGGGGHIILSSTETLPQRSKLKFTGNVTISDSNLDDITNIEVLGGDETDPIFNAWLQSNPLANYALQSWVTENFALKESGVVPPVSEDILLTTAAPSYTVVPETADNINVSSTAAVGTIVLNVLAADKALKISIKAGSNAVTIAGTAYNAGVVVFAVFTESTGTWAVDSTLDPVIPDYSDVKVQKRTTTAPQQMQFSYVISGLPAGGGAKGHLIFIDIPGSAFSGVYSSLVNFAGTTTYAQKIIEGTALNVVRVGAGAVYHSEYDGANLASLKFSIIAEKELAITKYGINGNVYPTIFPTDKARVITGYRLATNCTDFSVTIGASTYTKANITNVAVASGAELVVNDLTITAGQNVANAILILK